MLIKELISQRLKEDNHFNADSQLDQAVDDIILRLRQNGIEKFDVRELANEINTTIDNIYLNPSDPEFRKDLINILQRNDWVTNVSGSEVYLKQGDDSVGNSSDAGSELKKVRDKQHIKAQKTASKNIKRKSRQVGEL